MVYRDGGLRAVRDEQPLQTAATRVLRKIVCKRSDREKVSVSLWPNAPPVDLGVDAIMTRGNLGGGGVHEVVVLSARRLLAVLEECNPDASNNRASYLAARRALSATISLAS